MTKDSPRRWKPSFSANRNRDAFKPLDANAYNAYEAIDSSNIVRDAAKDRYAVASHPVQQVAGNEPRDRAHRDFSRRADAGTPRRRVDHRGGAGDERHVQSITF